MLPINLEDVEENQDCLPWVNLVVSWNVVLDALIYRIREKFFLVCDVSQIGPGCCVPSVVLYEVCETNIYLFSDTSDSQDSSRRKCLKFNMPVCVASLVEINKEAKAHRTSTTLQNKFEPSIMLEYPGKSTRTVPRFLSSLQW